MNLHDPQRVSAAGRLDRLPVFSFHRRMMWLLSFCFFFELAGINTFAYAAPAIRAQWGISIATISLITSGTFLGMFFGAATGGWFADRVGRKRALIFSVGWFSAFSLLNAFAWEPVGLFFARLMTGIGLAAMTAIAITYIAEMYPAQRRGAYQGWIMAVGLCGIPIAALVARLVVPAFPFGWRLVFVWGALGIIFPFAARNLEESPRWHEKRGQLAEADAILQRIETAAERETGTPLSQPLPLNPIPRQGRYLDLFAPHVRPRTFMLLAAWIFQTLGFYGFSAFAPTLLVEHGFKLVESLQWVTMMQFAGVPGAFIAGFVSDRWQRKYWISLFAVLIATCGLLYGVTFRAEFIVIFGGLMTMMIQAFAPLLYAYTAECFPTEIRSTGTGFTYGIGRLSNAAGPLLIAFLYTTYGYGSVFTYIAACWLVVAGSVAATGPLTRGRTL
jgi:putative MFS transporter